VIFRTKDKTKELIDSIWCDDYYIIAARESAPSKNELKKFAKEQGVKFSKEYIAHSSNFFGGLYLEVNDDVWPKAEVGDVAPSWTFLYGIATYAYSDDAPDWMNIKNATAEFKAMGHNVVPILKVMGDADVYCLNESGGIIRWLHEEGIFESYDGSFFDLLSFELQELEERRKNKIKMV
jgi:hypothetical protein